MAITQFVPTQIDVPNELMLEFFLVFSRFEYAMKAAGWTVPDRDAAEPDWTRLINEAQAEDAAADPLLQAGKYLLELPPKKQIRLSDGRLGWSAVTCDDDGRRVSCLLLSVKRVRNNLFHGGKYELLATLSDRNRQLLEGSLRVLELLLAVPVFEPIRTKYREYSDETN